MTKIDLYIKIVITIIAICLIKIAFFAPPKLSYAQLPFFASSDKVIDVNIKSIDDNEFILSRNGDLHMGGKNGPKIFENGAWMVRAKKE
ncbi:unnamed protein product [marine sediment metagenome]|uniref:Uncharacterized protein n=1 Tax=marine sediment metagenome TaxID=412755 RepID=X1VE35_9ZZZZ